jgi:putative ABC transport system permease protein
VLHLAWRGVRGNPGRYLATLIAIITGVAFFAATGFLSDRVLASVQGDVDHEYGNVDAAIVPNDAKPGADFAEKLRISGATYDRIAAVDGVAGVAGVLTGNVAFKRSDGGVYGNGATGRLWIEDSELNPLEIVHGRAPAGVGDVAVDQGLASRENLEVGDRVRLLTLAGASDVTVSGITTFGSSDAIDSGGTVSIPPASAFDWLAAGQREYQDVYLRGSGSQTDLVSSVRSLVPGGYRIQSGDAFLDDQRSQLGAPYRFLKQALQAFAILAMLVGGFVIYNTFSVIVTQRLRELAVMAAVGATPRQIKRALRYEGLVLGVLGSLLGVLVGLGLTFVLVLVLNLLGVDLPGSGVKIRAANVIGGVVIGTAITVASVMVPARKAARTEPIEALRTSAVERSPFSRRRTIAAAVLSGLGVLGLLFGGSAVLVGAGVLLAFVAVIVAGPLLAVGFAGLMRAVMSLVGLEGQLAVDNTSRSPGRTATTANALLIGVFLVTLISVAGTSVKNFALDEIKKLQTADYLIVSNGGTVGPALVSNLEATDGVSQVTAFRRESVTVDGDASLLFTGDITALRRVAALKLGSGSFDAVVPGTIAIVAPPDGKAPPLGSIVRVANRDGKTEQLKVVGVIESSLDTAATGSYVAKPTFDKLVGDTAPTVAFIDAGPGDQTKIADAIRNRTEQRPDIQLSEGNALGRLLGSLFDFVINAVNGLLAMSVIIALIGIVNTLSLSIYERRRELGLLRAVGMTDRRVQRMVRLESVQIAALGTVSGLLLGIFVGWTVIRAIDRITGAGIGFSLPVGRVVIILVLGVALGLLASLIPARRSTRLDVLDAIQAT